MPYNLPLHIRPHGSFCAPRVAQRILRSVPAGLLAVRRVSGHLFLPACAT